MAKLLGVIPARYASSRFPGKPLAMIGDKPMVQWVYEAASKAKSLDRLLVATDDQRIYDTVLGFGGTVLMTSSHHRNGTERVGEVIDRLNADFDYVLNIQGDEPFIDPNQIDELGQLLSDSKAEIGTLARQNDDLSFVNSPNEIKVVVNHRFEAMYFSRSAIPFDRSKEFSGFLQHVGLYGFSSKVLPDLIELPSCPLEEAESLEQLRWLYHGYSILVGMTEYRSFSIDTPSDLREALSQLS